MVFFFIGLFLGFVISGLYFRVYAEMRIKDEIKEFITQFYLNEADKITKG